MADQRHRKDQKTIPTPGPFKPETFRFTDWAMI